MNKKILTMNILITIMWICWLTSVIVGFFSKTAYWVLLGCWAALVIAIIVIDILIEIDFKKQEKKLNEELREFVLKHLLPEENKETKEE